MEERRPFRFSSEQKWLELDILDLDAVSVYISVVVSSAGFAGSNDMWVGLTEFKAFANQLLNLELNRKGEASLKGVRPEELHLKIFSTNSSGQMAICGETGWEVNGFFHKVQFGFNVDPSQIVQASNYFSKVLHLSL